MTNTSPIGDLERDDYNEFQFLEDHARWAGLEWTGSPGVTRNQTDIDGRVVSYLRWGTGEPELVLLHGGGQNAHTWDTFAMAIGRPVVAIDLPGHGHSDWRADRDYSPSANATTIAAALDVIAPRAQALVGMSLGGLTAIRLATMRADRTQHLVLVDITPTLPAMHDDSRPTPMALLRGPRTYESWAKMLDAAHASMPHRDRNSIIPGVRHNAVRRADGSWGWRYDRLLSDGAPPPNHAHLWDDLAALDARVVLVKGALSPIVTNEAIVEAKRRCPSAHVEVVDGSGHSVQSDRPLQLAVIVNEQVR